MGTRNETDTTDKAAAEAGLQRTASKRSIEDEIELNAIEDDEVRQILKIPARHKLPKHG
jgi:hypothetical protein